MGSVGGDRGLPNRRKVSSDSWPDRLNRGQGLELYSKRALLDITVIMGQRRRARKPRVSRGNVQSWSGGDDATSRSDRECERSRVKPNVNVAGRSWWMSPVKNYLVVPEKSPDRLSQRYRSLFVSG